MPERESYAIRLLWSALIPLLVGITVLLVEYWSGWFQQNRPNNSTSLGIIGWTLIALLMLMTVLFVSQYLLIWLRPYKHTREALALGALCLGATSTIVVMICMPLGLMPWSAVALWFYTILGRSTNWPIPQWSEYCVLILLYIILIWWITQSFQKWPGKRSVQQYEREQRNESASLIKEAFLELKRIVRRQPPFPIYTERNPKDFLTQLEPVTDSLAWRDQAQELVKLANSSYSFDADTDWHENKGCWIGSNVNTAEVVALFPRQESMNEQELQSGIEYVKRISKKKQAVLGEVIVATREKSMGRARLNGFSIKYLDEAQLLDQLVDFRDYFNEIKKRVTVYRAADSVLTLQDVYVPSKFSLTKGRVERETLEAFLNNWLADPSQRQLALLGEYGQGKSTAATMWAFHQMQSGLPSGRIPLLIELRGTSPRNLTPLGLLGAWASKYNINPQGLWKLLIAGRLTVIFEGFDEMALVGDAAMRLNHFRTLWQFAYPKAKILITGRPNFFLDEEEMKAALGISKPVGARPYCEAVRLEPFDTEQISGALRSYDPQVREQIHGLALKNERFKDLVSRPSLLQIIAGLWQKERLSQKVDQLTSAFILDLFVRQSYRREGLKDIDFPGIMALTTSEREYFMLGIASYMVSNELPNQITGKQLNQTIKELLLTIPDAISTNTPTITGETNRPLRNRTEDNDMAIEHLMTDVRACGLLVDDPSNPGTFRFGHKSFMEFLSAAVIADLIQTPSSESTRAIVRATGLSIEDVFKQPVAMDFLSELLAANLSSKVGEQSSSIARNLLRTITGKGIKGAVNRALIFWELFSFLAPLALAGRSKRRLFILKLVLPNLILVLPFLVVFFSDLSLFRDGGRSPVLLLSALVLLGVILGVLSSMFTVLRGSLIRDKLLLWLRLSFGMRIEPKDMRRASGTWLVPKVNKLSPYSYLAQGSSARTLPYEALPL